MVTKLIQSTSLTIRDKEVNHPHYPLPPDHHPLPHDHHPHPHGHHHFFARVCNMHDDEGWELVEVNDIFPPHRDLSSIY